MLLSESKGGEEKQEVPMEPSEPRPESEGPEPGPDEHPSTEPPGPDAGPDDEEKKEGSTQPKAFKRKISVVSSSVAKSPVATNSDTEASQPGGRKRRWGSSTAVTQKKPSISITTESLKSLIPEIKPPAGGQEAVVDLHADDSRISEDESERHSEEPPHEKALKICRTVTQVVPAEGQENGQGEEEEEEEKVQEEEPPEAPPVVAVEAVVPLPPVEHEVKKVTLSDTLTRRSISQQRSGVSITIDDPVRIAQVPSPPRGKVGNIVHICNLVRPFTLGQLKELLGRTGTLVEEAFWIDKIKSHCYVTYSTVEEAVATRNALHGVKWPQSNPKFLSADFAEQDELDFHRGLLAERPAEAKAEESLPLPGAMGPVARGERELSRRSEAREREAAVREQWAEREREMERRERTRAEREWDRDKVREGPRSRSRSRERRRKERPKSKEKKAEKKEKAQEEPPAKLLDDLFRKTKAAPCIYWLPLTDTQYVQRQAERDARARERERRRKELEAEEARQRERSRQAEREKRREHSRERERPSAMASGTSSRGGGGGGGERSSGGGGGGGGGGRERERERREAKTRHSRSRSRSTPVQDRGGRR
ncbi:apoptotic chromatin condensation inducer in the nucleus isoform X2 [Anolis carolinensis]|uniref:apoptotic chromatin condensation inducer in the nucleus isoform X2 n=1 Tax=Anolis carolinensis TaxID=28377 RepID=UPI002F2B5202